MNDHDEYLRRREDRAREDNSDLVLAAVVGVVWIVVLVITVLAATA